MITRNKKIQQRGTIVYIMVLIGFGGIFLSQTVSNAKQEALQSINNLVRLSDNKPATARIPLDYKSINAEDLPQYVESNTDEIVRMAKLMEGDWVRVNSNTKELNGLRIHFKTSDDGTQISGVVTDVPPSARYGFSVGDVKFKGLKGSFSAGFSIQDKIVKNINSKEYEVTDIQISQDGRMIEVSSGGDHLYTLEKIIK